MDYLLGERKAASSKEENRQLVDGKGVKQQRAIAEKRSQRNETGLESLLLSLKNYQHRKLKSCSG